MTDADARFCQVTVDDTDFCILEPSPFSSMWYSHKFKGPGLWYEVAISILGGDIVHINRPYACGIWPDIGIFCQLLINKLLPGEMVAADSGYCGEPTKIRLPIDNQSRAEHRMKALARARHETVNKRFKQFNCLNNVYCHNLKKHQWIFEAVVVITQLNLTHGEAAFGVGYI